MHKSLPLLDGLHSEGSLVPIHAGSIRLRSHCTSTSLGTCALVPVNTSLLVFQRWPFTLKQVLYEYELPVNFTRTSSFLSGHVFIQPV